jgi:hypothetical protein
LKIQGLSDSSGQKLFAEIAMQWNSSRTRKQLENRILPNCEEGSSCLLFGMFDWHGALLSGAASLNDGIMHSSELSFHWMRQKIEERGPHRH